MKEFWIYCEFINVMRGKHHVIDKNGIHLKEDDSALSNPQEWVHVREVNSALDNAYERCASVLNQIYDEAGDCSNLQNEILDAINALKKAKG